MTYTVPLTMLSHRHRIALLVALLEETPGAIGDRAPLAIVAGTEPPAHLEVELYHTHLPKLDEVGYVEWDRDIGTIERGPNWQEVAPLVERIYDTRSEK